MADEETARRRRWMGRAFVATVIPVGMVSAAAHPAFADPVPPATAGPDAGPDAAPDSGAIPLASQPLQFPAQATAAGLPTDAVGTLAAEIVSISDATQRLGEQAKAVQDELDAAVAKTAVAREAWQRADAVLAATRARVEATQAGTDAANSASPTPTGTPSSPAQSPTTAPAGPTDGPSTAGVATAGPDGTKAPGASTAAAREEALSNRAEATRAERAARQAFDAATDAEHEVAGRYAVVMEQFHRYQAALDTLNSRNANQLVAARAARDAYESSLATSRGASTNIAGMQASPDALAAVAFALSQLGKPYEWAAEGPDTYDCSGLMLASYLSVGVKLPRVANNQYGAGQPVLASQLLPGDLIFFSTNSSDWRQIHHVAMYIGDGKVVHAPTFGDVVKISPIWWTEYFGATRMIPAIAAPAAAGATPEPTASATPSESATPSPTGSATPDPTGTPTPAPTPTTTAPATTTPPVTPSPVPNPSPTPTPSETSSPSATGSSPSASATTAPASPTTTPATSPDPAVSSTTSSPTQQGRRRRVRG